MYIYIYIYTYIHTSIYPRAFVLSLSRSLRSHVLCPPFWRWGRRRRKGDPSFSSTRVYIYIYIYIHIFRDARAYIHSVGYPLGSPHARARVHVGEARGHVHARVPGVVYSSSFIWPCGGSRGLSWASETRVRWAGGDDIDFLPVANLNVTSSSYSLSTSSSSSSSSSSCHSFVRSLARSFVRSFVRPLPSTCLFSPRRFPLPHLHRDPLRSSPSLLSLHLLRHHPRTIRSAGKCACASGTFEKE